jgi:hypothetical protein
LRTEQDANLDSRDYFACIPETTESTVSCTFSNVKFHPVALAPYREKLKELSNRQHVEKAKIKR